MQLQVEGKEPLSLDKNDLIAVIDDTGHEMFPDSNTPLFGLGGCLFRVSDYQSGMFMPWRLMKDDHFFGADQPLQAADLRNPNQDQMEALSDFFLRESFSRFACLISNKSEIAGDIDILNLISNCLKKRLEELILQRVSLRKLILIFESSKRLNTRLRSYFQELTVKVNLENSNISSQVDCYEMDKTENEPFMEIADFIVHTAQCQVRQAYNMQSWPTRRKDFSVVFPKDKLNISSFFEITSVE